MFRTVAPLGVEVPSPNCSCTGKYIQKTNIGMHSRMWNAIYIAIRTEKDVAFDSPEGPSPSVTAGPGYFVYIFPETTPESILG